MIMEIKPHLVSRSREVFDSFLVCPFCEEDLKEANNLSLTKDAICGCGYWRLKKNDLKESVWTYEGKTKKELKRIADQMTHVHW